MIIMRLQGGMGNQMFQYACGRALSLKHGTALGLDLAYLLDRTARKGFTFRNYDLDVFNVQAEIVSQKNIPFLYRRHCGGIFNIVIDKIRNKIFKTKGVEKNFHFDSRILALGADAYLDGYWQSYKYFNDVADVIRKDFILKYDLLDISKTLLFEIEQSTAVCIHVRRGDFVDNTLHGVGIGQGYYNEGLRRISDKAIIDRVYVFSDDIEWCKANLKFMQPTTFVGTEYAGPKGEGHLTLMSACKHFVIANSSFSWWAAWLASYKDKIVIAPKKWFNDGSITTDDLIPKKWVRL